MCTLPSRAGSCSSCPFSAADRHSTPLAGGFGVLAWPRRPRARRSVHNPKLMPPLHLRRDLAAQQLQRLLELFPDHVHHEDEVPAALGVGLRQNMILMIEEVEP